MKLKHEFTTFGMMIDRYRRILGLSMEEFAGKAEMSVATLYHVMEGRTPATKYVERFKFAFDEFIQ